MSSAFPWTLRLEHCGRAEIRLQHPGLPLRFDPHGPLPAGEAALVSWTSPEHLAGVAAAARDGRRPAVVAAPPVLTWLAQQGEIQGFSADSPVTLGGAAVEALPYEPIPYAAPGEAAEKARSALLRPGRAVRRLGQRLGLPRARPLAWQLSFPSGRRLVHLNLALHQGTPPEWLDAAVARFGGADWLLLGVDHGHGDAALAHVGRFGAGKVLFVDLLSEIRRELGLPVQLLTPLVDRAVTAGLESYVFAAHSSFRFE